MKNAYVFVFAILALSGGVAAGQESALEALVGKDAAAELGAQGSLKRVQLKAPKQILVPRTAWARK